MTPDESQRAQWLKHCDSNNKVEENIQHAKNPVYADTFNTKAIHEGVGIVKEGWRRCRLNFLRMSEFYSPKQFMD